MDEREAQAWKLLALARGRILVAYRANMRVGDKVLDAANEAVDTLRGLGVSSMTGERSAATAAEGPFGQDGAGV